MQLFNVYSFDTNLPKSLIVLAHTINAAKDLIAKEYPLNYVNFMNPVIIRDKIHPYKAEDRTNKILKVNPR